SIPALAALTALVMMAGNTRAQEVDHVHLSKSESLQFDTILEQAMLQSPAYRELAVRSQEAQDYQGVGRSWIAGRPSVQVEYIDDSSLTDIGNTELTYGIALPIWRPGERGDMQALGQSYSSQAGDWLRQFKLDTAGKLRASLAALHEAETLLALEQQATQGAAELLRITEVLFKAGEAAQLDVMQARNLLLAQRRNELNADAMRVDAQRSYAILTGLTVAPANPHRETRVMSEEVAADHPLLQYLQRSIDLQEGNLHRAEILAKGSPTITLGSRRQRANNLSDYEDALAVSVSIPFGGSSFVGTAGSAARRAKVDAEVEYFTARRDLNAQLHEVEHQLFTLDQALPLSEEQATLSRQQWEMARSAFQLGETDISRVVIAMLQARASAKDFETLSMQYQRLITESNQILGVLP
ncbi:MAG: TolC family protein, partial [Congregibacter sp.]|nr:TolC family protein [Congregibacter sp.]